jgi:hypothetical protein
MYSKVLIIFFFCFSISEISSLNLNLFKNFKSIYPRAYLRPSVDYKFLNKDTNIPIETQEMSMSINKKKRNPLYKKFLDIAKIPEHLQEIISLAEILNLIQIYEESLEETDLEDNYDWQLHDL